MRRRQTRRGEGLCSAPGTPSLIGHYLASLEPLRPRAPGVLERAPGSLGVVGDAEGAEDAAGACTGSVSLSGLRLLLVLQEPSACCTTSQQPSSTQQSSLLLLSL